MTGTISDECAEKLKEIEDKLSQRISKILAQTDVQTVVQSYIQTVEDMQEARSALDDDCKGILDEIEERVGNLPLRRDTSEPSTTTPDLVIRMTSILYNIRAAQKAHKP